MNARASSIYAHAMTCSFRYSANFGLSSQPLAGSIAMVNGKQVIVFTGAEFDTLTLSKLASGGISCGSNSGGQHVTFDRGSMLFAPNSDIVVTTKEGDVKISAGVIAMIFEDGHDVAILNLSDR